ncbi:hypothetical protein TREMEDRAFT_65310 [Tremella mesenterica DSM 1558]|uniref:uncharacterized protein n=1 Tax=Tremella mesenterica (strain ATCC 24925 / CBS 8224 / DSM 1558 / NBRC 9311 / NRRL Y-6157 / RJB 2259-6 / UBC 559-6) TaxID=578456 RepID=UPI00032C574A|nr:uncharacterized protein TREMEDRAFT_65310 [Tremella mesenterica DSM 1558]EIW66452.1 hypothetical protein TREMEDRAFT_65310 [Tremella mesenterica DSM 1558]
MSNSKLTPGSDAAKALVLIGKTTFNVLPASEVNSDETEQVFRTTVPNMTISMESVNQAIEEIAPTGPYFRGFLPGDAIRRILSVSRSPQQTQNDWSRAESETALPYSEENYGGVIAIDLMIEEVSELS